ncbi:Alpha/beta hydrolase family protein [Arthrobacter ulcerisalmonis]|uniref:Alpha/beta hydrolase family protein n=2 Tax=Arthrobacter ulcerisalmonis TaxID=2483813 RepID=A0A3P5WBD3_9MICC|nr:Alpha/beta hydrolase family protein [Arthrobacter ulcerisalmonis]
MTRPATEGLARDQPPHAQDRTAFNQKRGFFWVPGDAVATEFGTVQRGQMYVEWMAPSRITQPYPLIFVHGGGGQGTDWLGTPDGRPGWAERFLREGYAVYVVDRPGHGRSFRHPHVLGETGPQTSFELASMLFAPEQAGDTQTAWPWARDPKGAEMQQLTAALGAMPADLAEGQRVDGLRMADLLDLVGPAVVITHSAGASAGWLALNLRPASVAGIVAIEPMGPPFAQLPGLGNLTWGLTATPVATLPADAEASQLSHEGPATIAGFADVPVAILVGETSPAGSFAPPVVDFLTRNGAQAELISLTDFGIHGNGHGLMFEANSEETCLPVLHWLDAQFGTRGQNDASQEIQKE